MKPTIALLMAAALAFAFPRAHAVPTPVYSGALGSGDGLRADFVELRDDWRGSRVPWNESASNPSIKPNPAYGNTAAGTVISDFDWGTGLWGLADAATALALPADSTDVVSRWSGKVRWINYGDSFYHQQGAAGKLPDYDAAADGLPFADKVPDATQDNWAARFTGYLAVREKGLYNFRLRYDDGARLVLAGGNGERRSITRDYLYPGVATFDGDLLLEPGLYSLLIEGFDHLFLGYINLSWSSDGGREWKLIDTGNLFSDLPGGPAVSLPEPASPALLALALAALALTRRRRASASAGKS